MRIKRKKKKELLPHEQDNPREEDRVLSSQYDPEGKIIFLNENITPWWLIVELTRKFSCEKNRGTKCGGQLV